MANNGNIFDIKRFAIHDGDGLRTTVFFKGCPLSCHWCHNPEGIAFNSQILWVKSQCVACESCVTACPKQAITWQDQRIVVNHEICDLCQLCIQSCPTNALKLCGQTYTIDEVLDTIKKDSLFYQTSAGGVTLSGGEIFGQFPFLLALVKRLKTEEFDVALETSFFTDSNNILQLIPYVDCLYIDIKFIDSTLHKKYCGVDNHLILKNIELFASDKMIIRVPLIPGINDHIANLSAIKDFTKKLNLPVECLNYNPFAKSKYDLVNQQFKLRDIKPLTDEKFQEINRYFN